MSSKADTVAVTNPPFFWDTLYHNTHPYQTSERVRGLVGDDGRQALMEQPLMEDDL